MRRRAQIPGDALQALLDGGYGARLAAGYCWEWSDPLPDGLALDRHETIPDRKAAIQRALAWAGAGDVVVIETETPFDGDELRSRLVGIGALAIPRFAAGEGVAARDAAPLYVRQRVALTVAERAAGARL